MSNFLYSGVIWFREYKGSPCYVSSWPSLRRDCIYCILCALGICLPFSRSWDWSHSNPNLYPISSSCPRPPLSHNCYPPKILSEDDQLLPPPRGKSLNSLMSAKALERGSEKAERLEWCWDERSKGRGLVGPRQVCGRSSRWWEPSWSFEQRSAIFWLMFDGITLAALLRMEMPEEIKGQNSGSIWRPAQ